MRFPPILRPYVGFSTPASIVCPDVVVLSPFLGILYSLPPLYIKYCRRAIWMSGTFRHSRRVLCRPCPAYILIETLASSVSVLCEGYSPRVYPGSTPGAMWLLLDPSSCFAPTFGRPGELDTSPQRQLSSSLLVPSASVESILVLGTLLPFICTTR